MNHQRGGGILLHVTSLPSTEGIGTFGSEAYRWVDRLQTAGQSIWQILPLGPTGFGDSPYQSYSAFAGNPLLIDLESLVRQGWLTNEELASCAPEEEGNVDYDRVRSIKMPLLRKASERFKESGDSETREAMEAFCRREAWWLEDYALFMALHEASGGRAWSEWEEPLRRREPDALAAARSRYAREVEFHGFLQYLFFTQWQELKGYAEDRGVEIIGDLPIYVAYDSSEVWARPELFELDDDLLPTFVAGVPPDYFSPTGQRWGNPLYAWDRHEEEGYAWWIARVRHSLRLYDRIRIDHFRGFEAYWAIPASDETAEHGHWRPGPGAKLFSRLKEELGDLPFIAEDLGIITPEVEALRDAFDLPGMKILQFAFDGNPSNPYLPHNHIPRCVLYTGTHDNDTLMGWFDALENRSFLLEYLDCDEADFHRSMLRTLLISVAQTAILPLQDLLGLGSEARMNMPGSTQGNWRWRATQAQMRKMDLEAQKLRRACERYARTSLKR